MSSSSSVRTITKFFRCQRFSNRTLLVRSFSTPSSSEIPFYGLPRPLKSERANNQQTCTLFNSSTVTDIAERAWLTWNNAITAAKDPTRADAVAAVGELTGRIALQNMLTQMQNDPIGRQILIDKPIVSKDTIPYERLINEARQIKSTENIIDNNNSNNDITFGQAYGLFLLDHGFDPDERDIVKYIEHNPDLAYVMTRYRQCHDFWHTLTGLPITVSGELGLKWLELFQTGLPMAALSCTVGSFFTLSNSEDRYIVWNIYLPWARKVHEELNIPLMNIYYEKEWDTSLIELRQRLNIQPAPKV